MPWRWLLCAPGSGALLKELMTAKGFGLFCDCARGPAAAGGARALEADPALLRLVPEAQRWAPASSAALQAPRWLLRKETASGADIFHITHACIV